MVKQISAVRWLRLMVTLQHLPAISKRILRHLGHSRSSVGDGLGRHTWPSDRHDPRAARRRWSLEVPEAGQLPSAQQERNTRLAQLDLKRAAQLGLQSFVQVLMTQQESNMIKGNFKIKIISRSAYELWRAKITITNS